jgi:hypothetical protein
MSVFSIAAVVPSDEPSVPKSHTYDSQTPGGDLICRPFGECEPCPADEVRCVLSDSISSLKTHAAPSAQIYQPYCHPYGNRRLVHCVPHQHDSDAKNEAAYSAEDTYFSSQKDAMTNHAHIGSGSKAVPHLQTAEGEDQDGVKVYITSWQGKKISWNDVEGEVPAWESCGKVIVAERQSYWRFVVSRQPDRAYSRKMVITNGLLPRLPTH